MPIPDYQACMLPLLKALEDGQVWTSKDLSRAVADHFGLTEEERAERLPSGQQTYVSNRVGWAKTYLKYAGLVDNPMRGRVQITEDGKQLLAENPPAIDKQFLKRFPSFVEFMKKSRRGKTRDDSEDVEDLEDNGNGDSSTPLERLEEAYSELGKAAAEDVLARVKECTSDFFEQVVVDLLVAMGYGGEFGEGKVTGGVGDGGIDGVIKEDKLGLDVVCVQAKQWEDSVTRPVVQQFVGSMDFTKSKKGVIITTSTFSRGAEEFIDRIEGKKVILIDGDRLARLMIEFNVGVVTTKAYELKEVSNDYFDEDE